MRAALSGKKASAIVLAALLGVCIAVAALVMNASEGAEPQEPARGSPLGMVLIDIADEKTAASYHVEECGVYVLAVDEDSQAYGAGIRSGDRIISVNGMYIDSTSEFETAQQHFPPESTIRVDVAPHSQDRVFSMNLLWNGEQAVQ